ncbi:hypothetical protein HGRIS_008532 [Hohenbuehelia grisea]|uniref:Enoyl reductase (ER) domain-containing protein n=1 Tax=Hohenbuehelia grisea TaxID=104357 RepID=A0ABR3J8P0_9AGAR
MSIPSHVEAITISKTGPIEVIEKTTVPLKVDATHVVIKSAELKAVYQDTLGAFATYISIPWRTVYRIPPGSGITSITAASSLVQGLTTVTFFEEAYKVKAGDTILIHTVAGGLGLLFTQLAKHRGAVVIGTTSTAEKAEIAKSNGADHVVLYKQEDTVQRVLEITKGKGVDAVFDGVGKDTFEDNFKLIKRKGTIVVVGNASGPAPPFPVLKLTQKNVTILRPTMNNYLFTPSEILHYGNELFSLISKNILKTKIWKEYAFTAEDVQQAQRDLTGGKSVGKLVIRVH